ncbi:hypothetical protein B4U80_11930, partial [Leptotrombidium deliense]
MYSTKKRRLKSTTLATSHLEPAETAYRITNPAIVFQVCKSIIKLKKENFETTFTAVESDLHERMVFVKNLKLELLRASKEGMITMSDIGEKIYLDIDSSSTELQCDVYCFKCCKGGEVLKCKGCFRVYHDKCFPFTAKLWRCVYCEKRLQKPIRGKIMTQTDLNDVIAILYEKLVSEFKEVLDASMLNNEDDDLRTALRLFLFKSHFSIA